MEDGDMEVQMNKDGVFASHDHISLVNVSMTSMIMVGEQSPYSPKSKGSRRGADTRSKDLYASGSSGRLPFDS